MSGLINYINHHTAADLTADALLRRRISQALFYLSFFVYMPASLLQYTSLKSGYPDFNKLLTTIIAYCVYAAIINTVIFADYSLMQLIIYIAVSILLYYSYKHCGTRLVYQSVMMALSARQVEWKKLTRALVWLLGAFLAVCLALYYAGVLTGFEYYKDGKARLVMGYNHPNVFGCILMTFALIYIAYRIRRLKWWDYLIVLFVLLFCWFGPMSRTASISLGAALLLMLLQRVFGEKLLQNVWVRRLLAASSPVCFLAIFFLSYFYTPDNAFLVKVNAALSGRLKFGRAFLTKYYHTFLGQKIKMVGTAEAERTGQPNMYLDSAYMRLYVSVGIIALCIFLALMIAAMLFAIRTRDWGIIIGLFAFSLYGISEVYMMYVFFDVFLIGAAYTDMSDVRLLLSRHRSDRDGKKRECAPDVCGGSADQSKKESHENM